ncbi:MAG: HEAT repeat domain-containing protein [Thermomicrobiales bacterium]|nr:HEAT repeat domain-containing protein [Thermomicrobiales bacterium]
MSRKNGQSDDAPIHFFNLEEENVDGDIDLDSYQLDYPQVSFEQSLEAIQEDALAPMDVLGFSNMTLKNIHELRGVWGTLSDETRETIAELVLTVGLEQIFTDFGRFWQVLLEDKSEAVKLVAARGATGSEETALIAPLIVIAEGDDSLVLREAAIRGLVQSVMALDFDNLYLDKKDIARLQRMKAMAGDESWPTPLRAAALETWSHFTMDDDTMTLIESFIESDNDDLQIGAMKAMIQVGSAHFTRFLERQLQSTDVDRREAAAYAMGMSGDEAVVPMLTMTAREDTEPAVREAAYAALGNLASKPATKALEELLKHASDDEIELIEAALEYANEMDQMEDMAMFYLEDDELEDEDY